MAVLAKHHGIPFYVVAPLATFDLKIKNGQKIPIEERHKSEVMGFGSTISAPRKVSVYNPAFDVTDHKLISAIVTEAGILRPPFKTNISKAFKRKKKQKT